MYVPPFSNSTIFFFSLAYGTVTDASTMILAVSVLMKGGFLLGTFRTF